MKGNIDEENCEENLRKKFNPLSYIPDENGKYIKTSGNITEAEKIALQQVWDSIHENAAIQKKNVMDGTASPLAYYIEKYRIDIARLSFLTGIPRKKIKIHLKPDEFKILQKDVLQKYATVFNISIEQFLQIS